MVLCYSSMRWATVLFHYPVVMSFLCNRSSDPLMVPCYRSSLAWHLLLCIIASWAQNAALSPSLILLPLHATCFPQLSARLFLPCAVLLTISSTWNTLPGAARETSSHSTHLLFPLDRISASTNTHGHPLCLDSDHAGLCTVFMSTLSQLVRDLEH